MFKKVLNNSDEITDYIIEFATGFIDVELVREYFYDCRAILKKVYLDTLILENENNHVRNSRREDIYEKLPRETMPPLVVENNKIIDGNHRYRVARKNGQKEIFIYEIQIVDA